MTPEAAIAAHIASLPDPKRSDLQTLHDAARAIAPNARLWFLDGRDEAGKVVTNPNIGYGEQTLTYADGTSRDFYRLGFSANKAGISAYIIGLDDKTLLARTYADRLGKADVTGYCIRFKALKDVDVEVLKEAMRFAVERG